MGNLIFQKTFLALLIAHTASEMDIIQFRVENLIKGDHKGGKKTVGRFRARKIDSKKSVILAVV